MLPRTALPKDHRAQYSKLRLLLKEPGLIPRQPRRDAPRCGKKSCRCDGDPEARHRSLYLGLSLNGKHRMLYIPAEWEPQGAGVGGSLLRGPRATRKDLARVSRADREAQEVALLRRFSAYLERRLGLRQLVAGLHDARLLPQIPTLNVWLSVFGMYVLRLRSFNALEQELRVGKRWEAWVGSRKPSADTIGRVFASMSAEQTAPDSLGRPCTRAWRQQGHPHTARRVVSGRGGGWTRDRRFTCTLLPALSGARDHHRRARTELEYYHRVVVAQWVGVTPPAILDLERIDPNEGEVVAARRLLERVLRQHSRLIDVISADALYLEAPFFKQVLDAGKHLVVVMKQERRDLYQDAERLRSLVAPQILVDGPRTTRLWDIPEPLFLHDTRSTRSGGLGRGRDTQTQDRGRQRPKTSSRRRPGSGSPTFPPRPSRPPRSNAGVMTAGIWRTGASTNSQPLAHGPLLHPRHHGDRNPPADPRHSLRHHLPLLRAQPQSSGPSPPHSPGTGCPPGR